MATFYLMNATKIGTQQLWPGSLIDDAQDDTAAIQAAGGRLVTSANATVAAAAVTAQKLRADGAGLEAANAVMLAAVSKSDAEGTDQAAAANATAVNQNATAVNQNATAVNQNATATCVAEARSGYVYYLNVPAADLTSVVNTLDPVADGALAIAAQPVIPCKLQVRIVDGDSSIGAGEVVLVGVGPSGEAVGQTIPLTGGTQTVTTSQAYATLTSATVQNLAGAAAGDTIGIGPSAALGLPGQKTPASSGFAVHKSNANDANEAVGTVDAAAGTIVPTTAPNGTNDYAFWYTFAVTVAQDAHTHVQDAHTHVQDAHTHVQDAHTHAITLS